MLNIIIKQMCWKMQMVFRNDVPHIWNSLPDDITGNLIVTAHTFRNGLETFFLQ